MNMCDFDCMRLNEKLDSFLVSELPVVIPLFEDPVGFKVKGPCVIYIPGDYDRKSFLLMLQLVCNDY